MHKNPNLGGLAKTQIWAFVAVHKTSNICVRSEDSLGICGAHANFVHKQVVIQIASNWNLFKTYLNIITPPKVSAVSIDYVD